MTEIPQEFLCPINLTIMKDPVIMPDGQTYERKAIEKALKVSPLSPITKKPLSMKDATTNYALKSMIQKFLEKGVNPLKKIEHPQKIDKNNKTKIKTFKAEVIDDPNDVNSKQNINCPQCGFTLWVPFNPNYDGIIKESEEKKDDTVV